MTEAEKERGAIVSGSVVRLKSDSLLMTALHRSKGISGEWWHCGWLDEQGRFQEHTLPASALHLERDPK